MVPSRLWIGGPQPVPLLLIATEAQLEQAFMAGFDSGVATCSEDTFDIPVDSKFEWFMEEHYSEN